MEIANLGTRPKVQRLIKGLIKVCEQSGRTDEAQRAAAAFRARFPRSVLLPAVRRMPARER